MGEIGIPRREYLYELEYWEVVLIVRGYFRKSREMWSATRWQTYNLMAAQVGGKQLSENGINSVHDLLPLPWDNDNHSDLPTPDEVAAAVAEMEAINNFNKQCQTVHPSEPKNE